jgi:hypothetical protein
MSKPFPRIKRAACMAQPASQSIMHNALNGNLSEVEGEIANSVA